MKLLRKVIMRLRQNQNKKQHKARLQRWSKNMIFQFYKNLYKMQKMAYSKVFELMIRNQKIVMLITTLSEQDQSQIKDFLELSPQKNQSINSNDMEMQSLSQANQLQLNSRLLDSNSLITLQQVQSHLQAKQLQIKEERLLKIQLQQEIQQLRSELNHKQSQIDGFKKRLINYEEIDLLLLEKDEEISSLNKKLTEAQVKLKTKQSEFINNRNKLSQKLIQLESKSQQFQHLYEKQKYELHELMSQKQESEVSMKKVISNLKQKNKLFSDKINEIQRQLIEINFQKQLKEKQLQDLKLKFQGNNRITQEGQYIRNRDGFDYQTPIQQQFSGLGSPRSGIQSNRNNNNRQRQYRNSNSNKLGEEIEISQIQKESFQQQLSLYTKDQSNKNTRLAQLLQQNQNLKRQVQELVSERNKSANEGSKQFKELSDQYEKLKKRLNIMKRRNQQLDSQRKDEIQIMVGALEEYFKAKI